jgi:hypothetical protein
VEVVEAEEDGVAMEGLEASGIVKIGKTMPYLGNITKKHLCLRLRELHDDDFSFLPLYEHHVNYRRCWRWPRVDGIQEILRVDHIRTEKGRLK